MKSRGFTLIEVLIALMIFAIVALITSSVLYQMFDTRQRTQIYADRMQEMQLAYVILSRDFRQAVPKPVFYNSSIELMPFSGQSKQVSFTRGGYSNPLQQHPRSELQRISLQLRNGELIRRRFDKLDHQSTDQGAEQIILSHVKNINFNYFGAKKTLSKFWPLNNSVTNGGIIPSSVELTVEFDDWGSIMWVFECRDA